MSKNSIKKSTVVATDIALNSFKSQSHSPFSYSSTITYDFTVHLTSGPLAGQYFQGCFSYNDSTVKGIGSEEIGVTEGLSIYFEFLGNIYTEKDDFSFPFHPRVSLENGLLVVLDFETFNSQVSFQIIRDFANKCSFFTYTIEEDETATTGSGSVTYQCRNYGSLSVPNLSSVTSSTVPQRKYRSRQKTTSGQRRSRKSQSRTLHSN